MASKQLIQRFVDASLNFQIESDTIAISSTIRRRRKEKTRNKKEKRKKEKKKKEKKNRTGEKEKIMCCFELYCGLALTTPCCEKFSQSNQQQEKDRSRLLG
jgi:hypothetical protein